MRTDPCPELVSTFNDMKRNLPFVPEGVAVLSMDALTGHSCCVIAPGLQSDGQHVLLQEPGRLVCEDCADVPVTEGLWYVIRQHEVSDTNSEPMGYFDTRHVW